MEARLCRKLCMLLRKGGLVLFDFPLKFSRSEKTESETAESLLLPQLEPLVSLQNSDLQGTLDPCDTGDFQEKMWNQTFPPKSPVSSLAVSLSISVDTLLLQAGVLT